MLLHELVQNGDGVQVPGDDLRALGVLAVGGDLSVLPENQLPGKAVFQHVGVVVGVVIGEDQGLFPLREIEGVFYHFGAAALVLDLAPHIGNVHQHKAPVIHALENGAVLIGGDHKIVDAVGLLVAVKGQLRIRHHRMEEQVLHDAVVRYVGHAVPGAALRRLGGVQNGVRFRLGRGRLRRLLLGGGLRL